MKKFSNIRLFAYCFISALISSQTAYAISKLDFPAPIADTAEKVGEVKEKVETTYNAALETLNKKVEKITGREGGMLFKYIENNATAIVTSAAKGQFYAADFTGSGMWEAMTRELGDVKLDLATARNQLEKYTQAREQEKLSKRAAMSEELAKLKAEHEALNLLIKDEEEKNGKVSEEHAQRFLELEKAIAHMRQEMEKVMQEDVTEDEQYKKMQAGITEREKKIGELTRLTSEDELVNLLGTESAKLFAEDTPDEETEAAYDNVAGRFFLRENEAENSDTIERIMKERKKEYYKAVTNSLEKMIKTYTSVDEIKERSVACTDAATGMAQGVFGAAGMRVCVELQNAKVAARYMEELLAQIRLETTSEMQSWKDKYRLEDYEKDLTKFNLDDYVLKKETLFKRVREQARYTAQKKLDSIGSF